MSSGDSVWVKVDSKLKHLAPVFLLLLIVYLYSSLVSPVLSKEILQYLEVTVISYFVSELLVKYVLADSYEQFLRDYWFDIVLLVPFFKSLRLLGVVGKVLKSIKGISYAKYVQKIIKIPKMVQKTRFFEGKSEKKTKSEKK